MGWINDETVLTSPWLHLGLGVQLRPTLKQLCNVVSTTPTSLLLLATTSPSLLTQLPLPMLPKYAESAGLRAPNTRLCDIVLSMAMYSWLTVLRLSGALVPCGDRLCASLCWAPPLPQRERAISEQLHCTGAYLIRVTNEAFVRKAGFTPGRAQFEVVITT